jgi:hypothetical protein
MASTETEGRDPNIAGGTGKDWLETGTNQETEETLQDKVLSRTPAAATPGS